MKGPSGRIRYRVRRHWKCPRCGKEMNTGGDVGVQPCPACPDDGSRPQMALIEAKRTRDPFKLPPRHE